VSTTHLRFAPTPTRQQVHIIFAKNFFHLCNILSEFGVFLAQVSDFKHLSKSHCLDSFVFGNGGSQTEKPSGQAPAR
jgi:hypothetical protein